MELILIQRAGQFGDTFLVELVQTIVQPACAVIQLACTGVQAVSYTHLGERLWKRRLPHQLSCGQQAASWRTAPEAIPDSEITKTYDVDVAIIGMGYAGLSCYRELAEDVYKRQPSGSTVLMREIISSSWLLMASVPVL